MPALPSTRRRFLQHTSIASAAVLVPAISFANPQKPPSAEKKKDAEEISPAEDLMREHGVLNRILLIYDHHLHMLTTEQTFDGSVLVRAADIVRHFVEDYHEKLEEDFLFPRFRKVGKLVNLVDTLLAQHKAGRPSQNGARTFHVSCCTLDIVRTMYDRNRITRRQTRER
jgi:hypothetical protein